MKKATVRMMDSNLKKYGKEDKEGFANVMFTVNLECLITEPTASWRNDFQKTVYGIFINENSRMKKSYVLQRFKATKWGSGKWHFYGIDCKPIVLAMLGKMLNDQVL